jgi:hypothetical protein
VTVAIDFIDRATVSRLLSDRYRVDVRTVAAHERELGRPNAMIAEVTAGLQEGQSVVVHPPDT